MASSSKSGFFSRVGRKLKPDKEHRKVEKPAKLQKRNSEAPPPYSEYDRQEDVNELGEREYSIWSETSTLVGGPRDHTEMLHGLTHHGSFDSLVADPRLDPEGHRAQVMDTATLRRLHEASERKKLILRRLPASVCKKVASFLDPADAAHLAMTCRLLLEKLGNEPFHALALRENRHHRIRFLNHMDAQFPSHLLCFPCGTYHRRFMTGGEKLRADFVNNPIYVCPKATSSVLPRMRLTHGRQLPYYFVQLATRQAVHSRRYGIDPTSLSRKWKDPSSGWTHQSRYMIHDNRLLLRIRSQLFASPKLTPTGERKLLYDPEEYTPFFSVCAHWRDGVLMKVCKCALSHVPSPPESLLDQMKKSPRAAALEARNLMARPDFRAKQCEFCAPARRCPACPTEYLVEVGVAEDPKDPVNKFKHVLVVTRWSDLGNGKSPTASPEWAAINGLKADYDSFSNVGRRAVAGTFESQMSGCIPGQRMISLNPNNKKLGEEGHGWY
jgi:hypothetical protein